jgi:hypothetical protein
MGKAAVAPQNLLITGLAWWVRTAMRICKPRDGQEIKHLL